MKRISTGLFLLIAIAFFACDDKKNEIPTPTITSFSPAQGLAGTTVTITGTNFSTSPSVQFGSLAANVTSATASEIKAVVPAGAVTAPITVKVGDKSATSGSSFNITPPPAITSFAPTQGPEGTDVVITGSGFSDKASDITVKFGTASAAISLASSGDLRVKVPAGATSGPLTITVGSQSVTSSSSFTVIPTPKITSLSVNKGFEGDLIVITGTNFGATQAANTVYLGVLSATIVAASTTELKITVPPGASDGTITVLVNSVVSPPSEQFNVITTVTVSTLAGSTQGFANGTGAAAKFDTPAYIAKDPQGNFYVSGEFDSSVPYPYPPSNKIRKITPAGVVTTFAGSTSGNTDANGTNAKFNNPKGIAFDSNGNMYIADADNHRIRKVSTSGDVTTFAGSSSGNADGNGTNAKFNSPQAVAVDANDNIYVLDRFNYSIRKITPAGAVTTLAGGSTGTADGTGAAAQFNFPSGAVIIVDGNSNLLVIDGGAIRKITPGGVVTTLIPPGSFNFPNGIAIGPRNELYVADFNNHRIQRVNYLGTPVTLSGNPSSPTGVDGVNDAATFHNPSGLVFDTQGNLYVADYYNHRIRKIVMD